MMCPLLFLCARSIPHLHSFLPLQLRVTPLMDGIYADTYFLRDTFFTVDARGFFRYPFLILHSMNWFSYSLLFFFHLHIRFPLSFLFVQLARTHPQTASTWLDGSDFLCIYVLLFYHGFCAAFYKTGMIQTAELVAIVVSQVYIFSSISVQKGGQQYTYTCPPSLYPCEEIKLQNMRFVSGYVRKPS